MDKPFGVLSLLLFNIALAALRQYYGYKFVTNSQLFVYKCCLTMF